MTYSFNLVFKLPQESGITDDDVMWRLADAGCTDSLVGLGLPGHIGLEFDREAQSEAEAVLSAIADVKRALPVAEFVELVVAGSDLTKV